ncbi:hypothetical protein ALC60_02543 [Trachymyrmex zeteki]|uniref:Uncharacterized protein n=1 Tax=Mycetomoellerius zeteki TaxID=64791 RepID=A0A151XDR6_9HYME|nr:hypothetical protein ALC60_02543 [Trachymyrmex zeteki]
MGRGRQKPVARDPPGPLTLTSRERGDTDEGTAAGRLTGSAASRAQREEMGSSGGRREGEPKRVDREIEAPEERPGAGGWLQPPLPPPPPPLPSPAPPATLSTLPTSFVHSACHRYDEPIAHSEKIFNHASRTRSVTVVVVEEKECKRSFLLPIPRVSFAHLKEAILFLMLNLHEAIIGRRVSQVTNYMHTFIKRNERIKLLLRYILKDLSQIRIRKNAARWDGVYPSLLEGRAKVDPIAKSEISPFLVERTGMGGWRWPPFLAQWLLHA